MRGLAFVRGAGKRKLLVREAEPVGGSGLDQRDGLQRLHSRPRVDGHPRVARAVHDLPGCIDDHKGAAVAALNGRAPHHLDEYRISAHIRKIVILETPTALSGIITERTPQLTVPVTARAPFRDDNGGQKLSRAARKTCGSANTFASVES